MRKKKKKSSVTKGEKILYGSAIFAFFLTSVLQIFCGTNIGNLKMEVEKGAWFRIGVNIQNPTDEDIVVYVKVKDVDLRIE